MPPTIRLIALDLDGTTLTSDREIHPENRLAIQRATKAGVQVVLASGRIYSSMERFAQELDLLSPMICANGAHVIGHGGGEILHRALDPRVAETVWSYAEVEDLHVNVYSRRLLYYRKETEWSKLYHQRLGMDLGEVVPRQDALGLDITKMMIVDSPARIPEHRVEMTTRLAEFDVYITESESEYLEFLPASTNKGTGLAHLAGSLGLEASQVAAIGDYMNDLEMVQWAGVGGAVANAAPQVLESADFVGPSNDQAGVARFIDWILANERQ